MSRNVLIRIAQVVVLLAVASSFAQADNFMYFKKKAPAGGGSYVAKDSNATGANALVIGSTSANLYGANSWTSVSAYTLKKVAIKLKIVGDPGSLGQTTLTIYVCSTTAGEPVVLTQVGTKAVSELTTSYVECSFQYSTGYAISDATQYSVVISVNAVGDASNYSAAARNGAGTEDLYTSGDGSTWLLYDPTSDIVFTTYSFE